MKEGGTPESDTKATAQVAQDKPAAEKTTIDVEAKTKG